MVIVILKFITHSLRRSKNNVKSKKIMLLVYIDDPTFKGFGDTRYFIDEEIVNMNESTRFFIVEEIVNASCIHPRPNVHSKALEIQDSSLMNRLLI